VIQERIADEIGPEIVKIVEVLGPRAPSWKHGVRSVKGRGPRDTYG
jgi:predicted nucleic acid-binding Zn ribbon protein